MLYSDFSFLCVCLEGIEMITDVSYKIFVQFT